MSRCPACGAHNPDGARWCGQCLEPFQVERSAPVDPAAARPTRARTDDPVGDAEGFPAVPPVPGAAGEGPATSTGQRRRGRRGPVDTGTFLTTDEGEVRWRCPVCEEINDIDVLVCSVCHTALADLDRPSVDWEHARRQAVLGPGLGHLAAGRGAAGWARLILAAGWLLGALALLATAGVSALAPATPLLVGVAVLWIGSVIDVERLARGGEELITARTLLWLVVGVLVTMLLVLLVRAPTPGT